MPTKHIDKLLWERIEQKTVDIVILQRKMVKDTDVLQCLIESALDNISDEELSELIKKNSKSWILNKERKMETVGFGSLENYSKEDFYSEIRAIRELMGNIDTFNPDKLIEKTGLLYVSCRDNDIAEICLGLISEIEMRATFIR